MCLGKVDVVLETIGGLTMNTILLALLIIAAANLNLIGDDAASRGRAIVSEADLRDSGYKDFTADVEMILRNRSGQESRRTLRLKALEVEGDGDKTLMVFDLPRDVTGTAVLTYSHATECDEQWIYLPALKRVKRIASGNRSGPFMGSEYAYEDLTSQEVEKYKYKYIQEATMDTGIALVVDAYPVDDESGYTRKRVWFDREKYYVLKVDFYDRKNELFKTLTFQGYQQYEGRHWRPDRGDMVNHLTGKETTMLWKNYKFKSGLSADQFTRNALKRIR